MTLYILPSEEVQGEVLGALGEAFVLGWSDPEQERTVFLDTFDWRIFRGQSTLSATRLRRRYRLHLWEEARDAGELSVRRLPAFSHDLPPGHLRDRLRAAAGIRRLLPRARIKQERRTAAILNEDTKIVVRIRVNTGEAALPDSQHYHPLPASLEILPLKGYGAEAQEVRSFLWRAFGLRAQRDRLLNLVMETLDVRPGVDPSDPDFGLNSRMKASEGVRTIQKALLSVMEVNEEGLIQDLDPEFLHDFRVAVRRSRAALGQMKEVFPRNAAAHFGRELKWLGNRTGPTRDMDVYLLKIPAYKEALPGGVQDELEPLVDFLRHKKKKEHRKLVRTLRTKRYRTFKEDWARFLDVGEVGGDPPANAQAPVADLASARIWKLYNKVLKGGMEAGEDTPAEVLHRLRILCKRLRYLMTFFENLYPQDQMKPLIKVLKGLQDNLGDFNDLHVQQLALRRFADEMLEAGVGPPETLMAMGRLMGQLETQQETERLAFSQRFREFARPSNLKRFKKLFRPG